MMPCILAALLFYRVVSSIVCAVKLGVRHSLSYFQEKEKSYLWPASLRQLRCWKVSPGEHVVVRLVLGFG